MASLTRPAAWTEAEQKQLETLARRYPSSEHSLVTQCAKIAAGLPRKSIRDVGARLRLLALDPLATSQPARPGTARHAALEKQCRDLLQQNVAVVSEMRENLQKIQLMDNIPLMRRFDANVRATFETLEALESEAQMPPFPLEVNTMYLAGGGGLPPPPPLA